jgi:hypothetical protein
MVAAVLLAGLVSSSAAAEEALTVFPPAGSNATGINSASGADVLQGTTCAAAGECFAIGTVYDTYGSTQAFVVSQTDGSWGAATLLSLPSNAASDSGGTQAAYPDAIACSSSSTCYIVGSYVDSSGNTDAFVASEAGGAWSQASEIGSPSNRAASGYMAPADVACAASSGDCYIVGQYQEESYSRAEAFVATESGGTWGPGVQMSLPSDAAPDPQGQPSQIACTTTGDSCSAVGLYIMQSGSNPDEYVPFVATLSGGWAITQVGLPGNVGTTTLANLTAVACGSSSCAAVGQYRDSENDPEAMGLASSGEAWGGSATELAFPAGSSGGQSQGFSEVACDDDNRCYGVGAFYYGSEWHQAAVTAEESGGSWATPVELTDPSNAAALPESTATAVACDSSPTCYVVGTYDDTSGGNDVMLSTESGGGAWGAGTQLALPSDSANSAEQMSSLSCDPSNECFSWGTYDNTSEVQEGLLIELGDAAPTDVTLPSISGTSTQGDTLTASNGTWDGVPDPTYTYQWQDCNASGGSCSDISGATNSTYTLQGSDVGDTVDVVVTASNSAGSASASAPVTSVIGAASPAFSVSPSGKDFGSQATSTPSSAQAFTVTNVGTSALDIGSVTLSGPGTSQFAITSDGCTGEDVGPSSTCVVSVDFEPTSSGAKSASLSFSDDASGSPQSLALSGTGVSATAPVNTSLPSLTGSAYEGEALGTSTGAWSGTGPMSFTYAWQDCNASGGSCVSISGATASTYTLQASDVGATVVAAVTATNAAGSATATSAPSAVVESDSGCTSPGVARQGVSSDGLSGGSGGGSGSCSPASTTAPSISGTPQDGQPLTTTEGSWSGGPTSFSYQWHRGTDSSCEDTGADIGSGEATYVPDAADVGYDVCVVVTATNSYGSTSAISAPYGPLNGSTDLIVTNRSYVRAVDNYSHTVTVAPGDSEEDLAASIASIDSSIQIYEVNGHAPNSSPLGSGDILNVIATDPYEQDYEVVVGETEVTGDVESDTLSLTPTAYESWSSALASSGDQVATYSDPIDTNDNRGSGQGWNETITSTSYVGQSTASTSATSGPPSNAPGDSGDQGLSSGDNPASGGTPFAFGASGTPVDSWITGVGLSDNVGSTDTNPTSTTTYTGDTVGKNPVTTGLEIPQASTAPTAVEFYDAATGTGLGNFTLAPSISVAVPANAYNGYYDSVVTLAIVSGP